MIDAILVSVLKITTLVLNYSNVIFASLILIYN